MTMYGPFKLVLALSFISILILIVSPLAIFIYQVMRKPECINVTIEDIRPLDEGTLSARVVLHYSLDVPLRRVRIAIGKENVIFENVAKGTFSREVTLTLVEAQRGIREMEIEIIGFRILIKFGVTNK